MRFSIRLAFACSSVVVSAVSAAMRAAARAEEEAAKPADRGPDFAAADVEFFEKEIQPLLQARCAKCHGGEEKIKGGLSLANRAAVLKGGDQGPAVDLDDPAESLLIQAINYDGLEMPPSGKLPKAEIELLTKWVEQGLPWSPGQAIEEE